MTDYTTNFNLISIHALRKESDCTIPAAYYANRYFNPRSP